LSPTDYFDIVTFFIVPRLQQKSSDDCGKKILLAFLVKETKNRVGAVKNGQKKGLDLL